MHLGDWVVLTKGVVVKDIPIGVFWNWLHESDKQFEANKGEIFFHRGRELN